MGLNKESTTVGRRKIILSFNKSEFASPQPLRYNPLSASEPCLHIYQKKTKKPNRLMLYFVKFKLL